MIMRLLAALAGALFVVAGPAAAQRQPDASATLVVQSDPQASLFLDGKLMGKVGPDGQFVLVVPGPESRQHALRVTLAGRRAFEQNVTLTPGTKSVVVAKLPALEGRLEVLTTPQAEVVVEGRPAGKADTEGRVEIGSVKVGQIRVQVRRPGYLPEERTVVIGAGEITTLAIELKEVARPPARNPQAPDFAPHRSLAGNTATVYAVAFSPDSRRLASGDHGGTLRLWDISTGRQLRTWESGQYPISRVAFSPDGRLVAGAPGQSDAVHIFELAEGAPARAWKPVWGNLYDSSFPCFAFSGDSRRIAVASPDKSVWDREGRQGLTRVLDADSGAVLLQMHACCGILSMPGGGWLVVPFGGKDEDGIRVFDGAGSLLRTIPTDRTYEAAALTADGRWLAAVAWGERDHIQLWDTATGRAGYTLRPDTEKEGFLRVAFSPDGRWLVSRSGMLRPNGAPLDPAGSRLKIWDMNTGQVVRRYTPETYAISVAWSPDGSWLALGMDDGSIKLWRRKQ